MTEADATMPAPTPLAAWKRVLFTLILAAFGLAVLEVSSRLFLKFTSGYDGRSFIQHEFDPYKNILPTRNYVDTRGIHHNAQGFRRAENVAQVKPESTLRVFLMGASTAYGTGGLWPHLDRSWPILPDSATPSAQLERLLAQRFPGHRVEVINAAIASTWTHHELIYLNQTILGFDPDLIVFLDGFNDFFHFAPGHDQFRSYAYGEQAFTIMGAPTIRSLLTANFWWFYRRSAFVYLGSRVARNLLRAARSHDRSPLSVDSAMTGLRATFPRNALAMVERNVMITTAAGVDAVFVLQPLLIMERERRGLGGLERELFEYNVSSYLPNYEAFMQQAVPYVSDLARAAVTRRGGDYLSAIGIYADAQEQIFTDYAHLTPKGNRMLAGFIEPSVTARLRARLARKQRDRLP